MNSRSRISTLLLLGVFILLSSTANSDAKHVQQIRYHYIDLGTLGGHESYSTGINNWGQVVGYSETQNEGEYRAFLWTGMGMKTLEPLDDDFVSFAWGINDRGQVVGFSLNSDDERRPVLWDRSGMHELESLDGTYSGAFGINRHGEVVGWATYPHETYHEFSHAVLWNKEGITDLTPFQSDFSAASSINNKGEMVGGYVNSERLFRAVRWNKQGAHELGTLGGDESEALWINNKGEAVGWCELPGALWHACLWTAYGDTVDLGALDGSDSAALSVNDHGDVVGTSYFYVDDNTLERSLAFIWTKKNGMQDLNTLVDLPSGVIVAEANSINDFGWIAGTSTNNLGLYRACLLIPYKIGKGMKDHGNSSKR